VVDPDRSEWPHTVIIAKSVTTDKVGRLVRPVGFVADL